MAYRHPTLFVTDHLDDMLIEVNILQATSTYVAWNVMCCLSHIVTYMPYQSSVFIAFPT